MQASSLLKSSSQLSVWKPYKSWRYPRDLLKSMPEMTEEELDLNLVQINLCAYYNPDVLEMLNNKMVLGSFYLQNRHVLENLVNSENKDKGLGQKINVIAQRFDILFINGIELGAQNTKQGQKPKEESGDYQQTQTDISQSITTVSQLPKAKKQSNEEGLSQKQMKQKFIVEREQFILSLSKISDRLFECKQGKTEEQLHLNKRTIFNSALEQLNTQIQQHPNSNKQIVQKHNPSQITLSQQQTTCPSSPYTFYFKHAFHQVNQINVQTSSFIPTKNRNPLKLDLGFAQFIYKNDDQLSHQIIAMQFIKYLNKIIGTDFIQQYEIIPEVKGAFYEFINGKTIAQIKKEHQDLLTYFKFIAQTKGTQLSKIQKRFAESYAGYCIAQFMLQIKDRNNANIMLKEDGTFFHIDLAFIFNAKPGGISFESAPFKMTKQYVKAMGGFESDHFKYFQSLLIQMVTKIYESREEFLCKLDILGSRSKEIRCFNAFDIQKYKKIKFVSSLEQTRTFVENLIDQSFDSWCTKKYDSYQWKTNKIPA